MKDQLVEYGKQNPLQAGLAALCVLILLVSPGGILIRLLCIGILMYTCLRAGKQIDL